MITLRESVKQKYYRGFPRIADCAVEETTFLQPRRGNVLKAAQQFTKSSSALISFTNRADGALPQTPPLTAAEARGEHHL